MKAYEQVILKYFPANSKRFRYYYPHCRSVTKLAIAIAERNPSLGADRDILEQAGMLHDIGICLVHAPDIGCYGKEPYLKHGFLGRELLEEEGFTEIAPVCERHIGMGITLEEIDRLGLPFPRREMTPQTIEEKIVCYADKFFSKSSDDLTRPVPIDKVRTKLLKHGEDKLARFEEYVEMFGWEYIYRPSE